MIWRMNLPNKKCMMKLSYCWITLRVIALIKEFEPNYGKQKQYYTGTLSNLILLSTLLENCMHRVIIKQFPDLLCWLKHIGC